MRLKNTVPSPLAFTYALKIISVSPFLKSPATSHGSYQEDDRDFTVSFIDESLKLPRREADVLQLKLSEVKSVEDLEKLS